MVEKNVEHLWAANKSNAGEASSMDEGGVYKWNRQILMVWSLVETISKHSYEICKLFKTRTCLSEL